MERLWWEVMRLKTLKKGLPQVRLRQWAVGLDSSQDDSVMALKFAEL